VSSVRDLRPIPTTAAEWVVRLGAPDVTPQERVAFGQWLEADHAHRQAYEQANLIESLPAAFEPTNPYVARLLAAVEAPAKTPRRWVVPVSLAAGAVLLTLAAVLVSRIQEADLQRVATRHGEQRTLTLPDGSVVQLNTDTQLAYRVDQDERHVKLSNGEAFFDVAKDVARQFIVSTPTAEISVIGTQFSVRTRADGVEVIVKEGKVDVVRSAPALSPARLLPTASADRVQLTSGKHLRLAAAEKPPQVAAVDAVRATAWRSGILDIDAMMLEDVVAEVNRYAPVPFLIEDDSIRRLRLSGRFRLDDTEAIRYMLREYLNVDSSQHPDKISLRAVR
jgi:transmembrane sensor